MKPKQKKKDLPYKVTLTPNRNVSHSWIIAECFVVATTSLVAINLVSAAMLPTEATMYMYGEYTLIYCVASFPGHLQEEERLPTYITSNCNSKLIQAVNIIIVQPIFDSY